MTMSTRVRSSCYNVNVSISGQTTKIEEKEEEKLMIGNRSRNYKGSKPAVHPGIEAGDPHSSAFS